MFLSSYSVGYQPSRKPTLCLTRLPLRAHLGRTHTMRQQRAGLAEGTASEGTSELPPPDSSDRDPHEDATDGMSMSSAARVLNMPARLRAARASHTTEQDHDTLEELVSEHMPAALAAAGRLASLHDDNDTTETAGAKRKHGHVQCILEDFFEHIPG